MEELKMGGISVFQPAMAHSAIDNHYSLKARKIAAMISIKNDLDNKDQELMPPCNI
jgi:hypothetical protein